MVGENHLDDKRKKELKANPDSQIVFLDYFEMLEVSFLYSLPKEHGGMGGIVGVRYDSLKDFVSWELEEYPPLVIREQIIKYLSYGQILASVMQKTK